MENIKCYTLCFPNWDAYARCFQLLHEADIVYLGHRQFNMFGRDIKTAMIKILTDPEKQFCDIPELMADPYLKSENEKMKIDFQIILDGFTPADLEYKEAALEEILKMTGGWKSELMNDKEISDWVKLYLLRLGHKNLNYTLCVSYEGNYGMSPNVFVTTKLMEEASALKDKITKASTGIADTGGDSDMGSISVLGGGGMTGWEYFVFFDAHDKKSITEARELIDETQKWMTEKGLGVDMGRWNADARRPDAYDYTQEEHDEMYKKLPPAASSGIPVEGKGSVQSEAPDRKLLPDQDAGRQGIKYDTKEFVYRFDIRVITQRRMLQLGGILFWYHGILCRAVGIY